MENILFTQNAATSSQIEDHFKSCNTAFFQDLSARVSITGYSNKVHDQAFRFESWDDDKLTGLLAVYYNDREFAFITNISISETYAGNGIASLLINKGIEKAKNDGAAGLKLEVSKNNHPALNFYKKLGFSQYDQNDISYFLSLTLRQNQ